jgi:hypothetical protein
MFYGATDALLDASMAAAAFGKAVKGDVATDLLTCYGFLQALYIQQDAVWVLSRSVGLAWHPNDNHKIKQIRDTRNRLTGHPSLAGEKTKPKRLSSAIISYDAIKPSGFTGFIYYEDVMESVAIDVMTMLQENESQLVLQLRQIEVAMDNQERGFRSEQAKRPLGDHFGREFGYLVEKLRCDLCDTGSVIQAHTHVQMIQKILEILEKDLNTRGFISESLTYNLEHVSMALDFMALLMRKKKHSRSDQIKFDLIIDGFEKNLKHVQSTITEIDDRLKTPII